MRLVPDAKGRLRPTFAPLCCKSGIWVIHPIRQVWVCSECSLYGPEREGRTQIWGD